MRQSGGSKNAKMGKTRPCTAAAMVPSSRIGSLGLFRQINLLSETLSFPICCLTLLNTLLPVHYYLIHANWRGEAKAK